MVKNTQLRQIQNSLKCSQVNTVTKNITYAYKRGRKITEMNCFVSAKVSQLAIVEFSSSKHWERTRQKMLKLKINKVWAEGVLS